MKKFIIILLLLTTTLPAQATNWLQISQYDYIDLDSISNIEIKERSNTKSVWTKSYNDGTSTYRPDVYYLQARLLIDCNTKENTIKSGWSYDKNHNIIQQANFDNNLLEWNSYIPNSRIDTISQYICKPDIKEKTTVNTSKQISATDIYNEHVNSMIYINTQNSQGSGVIVQEDGTFITCFHVIENADYITIKTHDGRTFKVNGFKYINPTEDVAILIIDAPYTKFKPIDINHSGLQVGEKVYTISNPQGLEFTFSDGMINQYKKEYIQFSAPASPGSSGGALLNENGQLIGIITSQHKKGQNINFALPNEYYVSQITNLPIKNTYNQNWTKFLLSQTGNNQFKISTNHTNLEEGMHESYYNRLKKYVALPNFPTSDYALVAFWAFGAYIETWKPEILKDAIKWYELSLKNNVNIEVSLYALAILYLWNNDEKASDLCINMLEQYYPAAYNKIILDLSKTNDNKEKFIIYWDYILELSAKCLDNRNR